jgi:hypothetical protein
MLIGDAGRRETSSIVYFCFKTPRPKYKPNPTYLDHTVATIRGGYLGNT